MRRNWLRATFDEVETADIAAKAAAIAKAQRDEAAEVKFMESKKQNTYNKRDSDSDNPYDVEPDKPKGAFDYKKNANAAKVESDEEDNEDLFEAPSQEIKGGSKNIKEKQDEIKDEYDFDIPGNII